MMICNTINKTIAYILVSSTRYIIRRDVEQLKNWFLGTSKLEEEIANTRLDLTRLLEKVEPRLKPYEHKLLKYFDREVQNKIYSQVQNGR